MQTILEGVSVKRSIRLMRMLTNDHRRDVLPYQNYSLERFFTLVKNLPYDAHEYKRGEILKRPRITLKEGGDCDDKAIAMAAFLATFPSKMPCAFQQFFITADFGAGEAHVFNGLLCSRHQWFYIDATYKKNKINTVYGHPKKLRAYKI